MNELMKLMQNDFMQSVKEKVDKKYQEINPSFSDSELSKLIFRGRIISKNKELIAAHIQSIKIQLDNIYNNDYFKKEDIFREFTKSVTLFDRFTGELKLEGGTYGDNFISSKNFYLSAVGSSKINIFNYYQGSMEFSCIPLKLRLAIEIYFKNMIGYNSSSQEFLVGKRKGEITLYPLSIANLLSFFSNEKYKKYCTLPVDIKILKDINFWTNNLVHTGIISFAWQNLHAIDLLTPLFCAKHENGSMHIEGFNYLSPDFTQSALENDLNEYLSDKSKKVSIKCLQFLEKPIEGAFYYPRNMKK